MAKENYGNSSISALKGADRVRKRPAVIFGSDDIEGCKHAFFEILSNSIDEAREGYGKVIEVRRYLDRSIEVEDHGRGIPVDYNPVEQRFNWELVFCELYAGGKYNNVDGENYEFSLDQLYYGLEYLLTADIHLRLGIIVILKISYDYNVRIIVLNYLGDLVVEKMNNGKGGIRHTAERAYGKRSGYRRNALLDGKPCREHCGNDL